MARCKHFNMLTQMVTELPLLMANCSFKYLDCMQDQELEKFVSYLVRYCSEKHCEDPRVKPEWWGDEVKFYHNFYTGKISLPFIKHKQKKLRKIIQNCYAHFDCRHLLVMSERLACRQVYDFEKNLNDTVTVYVANTKTPLVVIPQSNLDYDLIGVSAQLMNSGLVRQVSTGPLKKASMITYDGRAVVTVNDSESDSDCVIIGEHSSEDEISSTVTRSSDQMLPDEDYEESSSDDFVEPKSKRRLIEGQTCVDLTLDEDDDERFAILEAAKARFLEEFDLMRCGCAPPDQQISPPNEQKRKSRFSLKKFSLDQVPFLVRIGLLPRRCMTTVNEITARTRFIEKYTQNG